MKKTISALLAAATVAGSLVSVAPAQAGNRDVAAGVAAGLHRRRDRWRRDCRSRPAPVYGPGPAYVDEPACRFVRERYWDGYDWRFRRVQVCD